MPKFKTISFLIASLLALTPLVILLCCSQESAPPPLPVYTARRPKPITSPHSFPATSAASLPFIPPVLEKPTTLGPVGPPIVILPDRIAEPMIRVKLQESAAPPVIPANKYRGTIQIIRLPTNKFAAINTLPLDDYLQGVLAKELYASWEPAAYRAQAIAARTFALYEMLTDGQSKSWDVNDDESSQMYGGIAGETAKAKAAVADTKGQVLQTAYAGKIGIFCARYSACTGGATQDPYEAWGDASVAPLAARAIGNIDDNCDKFIWKITFTAAKSDITRCIQSWGIRNNLPYLAALGPIQSVTLAKRNPATSRPTEFQLTDTAGRSAPIRAEEFRLALLSDPLAKAPKPYSSFFDIKDQGDSILLYNGRGYGHGIGLSQWGAQALAKSGQPHQQILAFFYPGAQLKKLW